MLVHVLEIPILVSELQFLKQVVGSSVTDESERLMVNNFWQFRKQEEPIDVNELGTVTDVNALQLMKQLFGKLVSDVADERLTFNNKVHD
jgi:hypothetical protein